MKRKVETREVVAAEWINLDGEAIRGRIVKRTKTTAHVTWETTGRTELVQFSGSSLRFLTADEIG